MRILPYFFTNIKWITIAVFMMLLYLSCETAKDSKKQTAPVEYKEIQFKTTAQIAMDVSTLLGKGDPTKYIAVSKKCSHEDGLSLVNFLLRKNSNKTNLTIDVYRFNENTMYIEDEKVYFKEPFSEKNDSSKIAVGVVTESDKLFSYIIKNGKPKSPKFFKK